MTDDPRVRDIQAAVNDLVRKIDQGYDERNRLVVLLSKLFPASVEVDPQEPDWPVVIIELPTGQASWHLPKDMLPQLVHLPTKLYTWDGHTTDEKHRRIEAYNP